MRALLPPSRLDHLVALRLTGPDRVVVLQGQTSNDARRVDATHAQFTSFNNPKGRCYAIAVLAAWDDAHYLIVERSVAELLCTRLRMYILRAKATVEIASDLAVTGRGAVAGAPAPDAGALSAEPRAGALHLGYPGARELALMPTAQAATLADASTAWRLADIEAGVPTVVAATVEHFVPLWLGLERLGAIDYKKGCYTGQEIVARTHYLGTVKQRLYRARCPEPAAPGGKVLGDGDQALGEVVSCGLDGEAFALLFVARDSAVYRLAEPPVAFAAVTAFD